MNQGSAPKNERRKHPRAKFREKVTLYHVTESKSGNVFEVQGPPLTAKAQDLSEGGIRLEIQISPASSGIFKLNFQVGKDRSVDLYSKLAWAGNGFFGLQFLMADEEARRLINSYVGKSL
jgi:PilZ domain